MNNNEEHLTEEEINLFIDGELPEDESEEIQQHILICDICADRVQQYQSLFLSLKDLEPIPLDQDLSVNVLANLPIKQPELKSSLNLQPWMKHSIFAFQIIVTLVLLAVFVPKLWANLCFMNFLPSINLLQSYPTFIFLQWTQLVSTVNIFFSQYIDQIGSVFQFQLPWIVVSICLSVSIILWLVVNSVLLGNETLGRRHHRNY